MIKVKNGIFSNQATIDAIKKLTSTTAFGVQATFDIIDLRDAWDAASKKYWEIRDKYIAEFCEKGEDGNPLFTTFNNQRRCSFDREGFDKFSGAMTELDSIEVELAIDPLIFQRSKLPDGILSADDIIALRLFVSFIK